MSLQLTMKQRVFGFSFSNLLVHEGERIPVGYGIAWHKYERDAAFCLPIGINVLARWVRNAYLALKCAYNPDCITRAYAEGLTKGRQAAWAYRHADGYQEGFVAGFDYFRAYALAGFRGEPVPAIPAQMKGHFAAGISDGDSARLA